MPFSAVCPDCRAAYQIGDQFAGRSIRCKKCQKVFAATPPVATILPAVPPAVPPAVAASPPPRPPVRPAAETRVSATARRSPPADAPKRPTQQKKAEPKSRKGLWLALIGGGVAAFFLVSCIGIAGVAWVFLSNNSDKSRSNQIAFSDVSAASGSAKQQPQAKDAGDDDSADDEATAEPGEANDRHAARGQLSTRARNRLKGATVYIKVEAGQDLSCSGSGFLVKTDGDTGYIVTNHHVVNPEAELLRPVRDAKGSTSVRIVKYKAKNAVITTVFHSGTKAERTMPAQIIATDESRDLAVLRVSTPGTWPRPIALKQKTDLVETMPVFILGFPFGESLSMKQGNPAITINKGSVSSLRENDFGQMKAVQIDGAINPGNSGGPVVDEDGRLVGISVATIRGSGIGLAIAPDELTRLFEGRIGSVALQDQKVDATGAEFHVEVGLIDPEGQIKSIALLYVVGTSPQPRLKIKADGEFDPLPGAERLDLQIDGQKASGQLQLELSNANQRVLNFQTTYVNGAGKTVYTQVGSKPIRRMSGTKSAPQK